MCTSPLIRFRLKKTASPDTIIGVSSSYQIKSLKDLQSYFLSYSAFKDYFDKNMDYQYIKCRRCTECRIDYAQDWSIRCFHEFQMRKLGCFITLTIDDTKAHLFFEKNSMKRYCKRCKNGDRYIKYPINYTLSKGFIQDELKLIRDKIFKDTGISVRYFGCGEYGSEQERPHYHLLLFGYNFPDRHLISISKKGVPIYHSPKLQKYWRYGLATLQEVNHRACMYTAKYCIKKLQTSSDLSVLENYHGREPEFLFMSRGNCNAKRCPYIDDIVKNCKGMKSLRSLDNPYCLDCKFTRGGLGFDWFQKYYKDVLKIGYITIDGIKYQIPKYYLEILKLTDPDLYDKYKIKLLNKIDELDEKHPDERSQERLNVKAKVIKGKLKAYHRE